MILIIFSLLFLGIKSQCETCKNGEECCSGYSCCGGGDQCCLGTSETCCPDPVNGSICCLTETTFCCPRTSDGTPSHCCPRWMVCCTYGRYGCCDPGEMPPKNSSHIEDDEDRNDSSENKIHSEDDHIDDSNDDDDDDDDDDTKQSVNFFKSTKKNKKPTSSNNVLSMFEIPTWSEDGLAMTGFTFDTTSGYATNQVNVTAPYNNWGEISRVFTFDPIRHLFYLLQATYLPPGKYQPGQEPIYFYSIDPVSGAGNKTLISQATGLITGFVYNVKFDAIIFSTYKYDATYTNQIGYTFFHLSMKNPTKAIIRSTYNFPQSDDWTGWYKHTSTDGRFLYRLGYQDVINSVNFGIGITDISTPNASTTFRSVFAPSNYENYVSLTPFKNSFLSLAPYSSTGDLSLFQWSLNSSEVINIANLGDAQQTPHFGPILEAINLAQTSYSALVVSLGVIVDTWTLVSIDLTNNQTSEFTISPELNGETDSPFGLGFPQ